MNFYKSLVADDRKRSFVFLLLAAIFWSTGGLLIKMVSWNPIAISGSRSLISCFLIYAYLRKPQFHWSWPLVLGSIAYAITVILFVFANKLTTAANAILLQYTAPVWVALMSSWLLKERIRWYDWVSIATTLLGMTLFFKEGLSTGNLLGNVVAVCSGIGFACVILFLRMQKDGSPVETVLVGNFITFLVSIPFIATAPMPSPLSILGIVLLGLFQLGLSYILYSSAIRHVTAIEGALIPVIEPLLNPIWVFLYFKEVPSLWAFIGGSIVIASVTARSIYTAIGTRRQKKRLSESVELTHP